MSAAISAADWYERRRLRTLDSHLSYVEVGVGAFSRLRCVR